MAAILRAYTGLSDRNMIEANPAVSTNRRI